MTDASAIVFLVLFLFFSPSKSEEAVGVQLTFTDNGLAKLAQNAYTLANQMVPGQHLDDASGSFSCGWFGGGTWTLSNLVISQFNIQVGKSWSDPTKGLVVNVQGGSAKLDGHARAKCKIGSASSNFYVAVSSLDMTVSVGAAVAPNGSFYLNQQTCQASIGYLHIHFSNDIIDLIKNIVGVESKLKSELSAKLCVFYQSYLSGNLNNTIYGFSYERHTDSFAHLLLAGSPQKQPSYTKHIQFYALGEFIPAQHNLQLPGFSGPDFPLMQNSTRMCRIVFTEYVPDSAAWTYNATGFFNTMLTNKNLPDDSPIKLDASLLTSFAPDLAKKYEGKNLTLTTKACASNLPKLHLTEKPSLNVCASVDVYANVSESEFVYLMTLKLDYNLTATPYVWQNETQKSEMKIKCAHVNGEPKVTVQNSTEKITKISALDSLVQSLSNLLANPYLDYLCDTGFLVPNAGNAIQLENTALLFGNGSMVLESDFELINNQVPKLEVGELTYRDPPPYQSLFMEVRQSSEKLQKKIYL